MYLDLRTPAEMQKNIEIFGLLLKTVDRSSLSFEEENKCLVYFEDKVLREGGLYCDGAINWTYPMFSAMLAILKKSYLWDRLSEEVKEKLTFMVECLVVITSFMTCDKNLYRTGIGLRGNVYKGWNPNIQMSLVGPMIFLADFLGGADIIDALLIDFDYDNYINRIREFSFIKTERVWTTPSFTVDGIEYPGARELLSNNGEKLIAYIKTECDDFINVFSAGKGLGIKRPYFYQGCRADDIEILRKLLIRNYSGGFVTNSSHCNEGIECHILDGTETPWLGQEGMMLEFSLANRSCALHGSTDFFIVCEMLAAAKFLNLYDWKQDRELKNKIEVGNNDLLYKVTHGWHSYALRKEYDVTKEKIYRSFPDFIWTEKWWNEQCS